MWFLNISVILALTLRIASATDIIVWQARDCTGIGHGCGRLREQSCCILGSKPTGSMGISGSPWAGVYVRAFSDNACGKFQTHRGSANPPSKLCHPLKKGTSMGSARWWEYANMPSDVNGKRDLPPSTDCRKPDMFLYTDEHGVQKSLKIPEEDGHLEKMYSHAESKDWAALSRYQKY